jgi:Raf kinase inhibitor-like YbhB/YbcL family protein
MRVGSNPEVLIIGGVFLSSRRSFGWRPKGIYATLIFFFLLASQNISGGEAMEITSAAFKDKGKIPIQYVMPGAGGKNISVPVAWKNIPAGTKSFALSMVDPHPVAQNWVHWLVIHIPKEVTAIEEGASRNKMPLGSVELKNSFGDIGYGGPQPPKGTGDHPYVATIYALNVEKLELGMSPSLSAFKKATEGKVIESASITGMYGR